MTLNAVNLIDYKTRLTQTTWLDCNTNIRANGKPDLLPDILAINNAILNLFGCPIGSRGRIFQPTYGTYLYQLLQEPFDQITADKIYASLIQSLQKWEPRVQIDYQQTRVAPVTELAGYMVIVAFIYLIDNKQYQTSYFVNS